MKTGLRILHLEDNPEDAAVIENTIKRAGIACEIQVVDTKEGFLDSLDQGGFDIILADYALPSFDGLSGLRIAAEKSPGIPFILVSGMLGEERTIESLKMGATDYVLKNRLSRLVPCIKRALKEVADRRAREQAEAALRETKERYELVVAGAEAAIWDWDVPAQRVFFSPRWKELRGLSDNEVSDREEEWSSRIHPDDFERVMGAVREHFEGRTSVFSEEYRVRHKDGHWIWILDHGIARRDAAGRVVRMAGSETDITERKRAEEETRRNLERIHALHEIDRAINATLDLQEVLEILLEKVQVFCPVTVASTIKLLSTVTGELESVAIRSPNREEWQTRQWKARNRRTKRIVESREPLWVRDVQQDPLTVDPEFFRKYGVVSYLGVPLIAQDRVLGVLGLFTRGEHEFGLDEVEFLNTLAGQAAIAIHNAQLFEQIKRQALELEKANNVKGEFLGVMSHELRTPLNITMGYVEMMKDGMLGEVTQEQKAALQKVLNQCADQLRMVNDILVTTHLESRVTVVDLERVDLSDVFNSLKSDFRTIHDSDQPELVWDYPGTPLALITDRRKVRQIVQNLVSNALKFTERGRISVSLKAVGGAPDPSPVSAEEGGEQGSRARLLELKVSDTGVGIPPDKLDEIFEKFRQVDSSATRLYGGLGLGLYIVKQFTELLGGKITVETELGRGSTFTVTIPART